MFGTWKQEKAIAALVDEAQALADKLAVAKPHFVESYAAKAVVWAAIHLAEGVVLADLIQWKPAAAARFAKTAESKIAALRKAREYSRGDGLTVWMHSARAVNEPRITPAVRAIWRLLARAGSNADAMAEDLLGDAELPTDSRRIVPKGFEGGE